MLVSHAFCMYLYQCFSLTGLAEIAAGHEDCRNIGATTDHCWVHYFEQDEN